MTIPGSIADLIVKYQRDEIYPDEMNELQEWIESSDKNKALFDELTNEDLLHDQLHEYEEGKKMVWANINRQVESKKVVSMLVRSYRGIIAAAVALVVISGVVFLWANNRSSVSNNLPAIVFKTVDSIMPAHEQAVLTLANGSTMFLDEVKNGTLAKEKGANVIKQENGQLIYQQTENTATSFDNLSYNTVSTARGRQYHLVLSDGTQIWLNAASSISYPVSFAGLKQRKVTITGEVYFEVTPFRGPGGKIPFIVDVAGKGEIEVLGTHFNINAYANEATINTTLLEGSVKVSTGNGEGVKLKPGQQAVIADHSQLTIHHSPNIAEVMAWKNGQFMFKSATLETILKQTARWYDIDVIYENGKLADRFNGTFSREVSLGQLLKILQYSNVNIRLEEGRRLVISH